MKAAEYVDIGQYLHDSRESLHVTVEQAAMALHIRAKYLRALENGHLEDLPGKAYIRGYIRNYAEYLGLDSREVLEAYESLLIHKGREFFVPEPTLRQNLPSRRVLWGTAIGMILLYSYWYFSVHDSTPINTNTAEMPQEFMQILDKTSRTAMDKAWENCMDSFSLDCFTAIHSQTVIPPGNIVMHHDEDFRNTSPQKP